MCNSVYLPVFIWQKVQYLWIRVMSTEMKYLSKAIGHTRRDRINNSTIKDILNVESLVKRVENCNVHISRMGENRILDDYRNEAIKI